jgi:hypothetical protein
MKTLSIFMFGLTMLAGLNYVDAGGETVKLGGLTSKTPAGWQKQKPSSSLRMLQMSVPKAEGDMEDAELAIFYFQGGGGNTEDNLRRWKSQFIAPKGKTIDDVSKLEKYKVGKVADVVCLDVSGTYLYKNPKAPNAKEERKENFRRFNVILDTDKDTYFITLTGPAKTMQMHKEAFDNWIKAFK